VPAILVAQSSVKDARKAFENAARDAKVRRIDQARRGYDQAVKLDPGYAEAWSALGRLQAQQQQYDAARKSFETAIRADPNLPDPYPPLAIILQSGSRVAGVSRDHEPPLATRRIPLPRSLAAQRDRPLQSQEPGGDTAADFEHDREGNPVRLCRRVLFIHFRFGEEP